MCGICGVWRLKAGGGTDDLTASVVSMSDALVHRGPDDSGSWADEDARLAFAHRRLSIIDVSSEGRQPMVSASGRHVLVYNGEAYNFPALRDELAEGGATFRGHSDTEVFLAAVERWGVRGAVERTVGMFAFALWDRQERTLHLGRDRIGIKPLYYGWCGQTFLFGSELKALRRHPDFDAGIDRDVLALYFRHAYVPAPYSIHKGIFKLPAGCLLTVSGRRKEDFSPWPDERRAEGETPEPYWRSRSCVEAGMATPFAGSYGEATDALEGLLRKAVEQRMISDVPLGVFLSGGVDSSLIAALMCQAGERPVQTFTIGFDDDYLNEADHAREVAAYLGTRHTEMIVSPQEGLNLVPRLPEIYDEPFADSSQIPTTLLSMLARQHVTVALSGDGGDELFAGYRRYFQCMRFWHRAGLLPQSLRKALATGMGGAANSRVVDLLFRRFKGLLPGDWASRPPQESLTKLSKVVGAASPHEFYLRLSSMWERPGELMLGGDEPKTCLTDPDLHADTGGDFMRQMMYLDLMMYHPDDILTKVDRASMSVGLEARVPLVDHRVVEFAARLPSAFLVHEGAGKRILREVLYRHVPRQLIDRPKSGFAVPLDDWLRTDLRDWAESLLAEDRLRQEGMLNPGLVRQTWDEHLSGAQDWKHKLWCVLMFQAWREGQ